MEYKQFEEGLNSKFENFQPDINDDAIWAQVEPRLEKKDRKFTWFYLFGFMGIIAFTALYFYSSNDSAIEILSQHTETESESLLEKASVIRDNKDINLEMEEAKIDLVKSPQKIIQINDLEANDLEANDLDGKNLKVNSTQDLNKIIELSIVDNQKKDNVLTNKEESFKSISPKIDHKETNLFEGGKELSDQNVSINNSTHHVEDSKETLQQRVQQEIVSNPTNDDFANTNSINKINELELLTNLSLHNSLLEEPRGIQKLTLTTQLSNQSGIIEKEKLEKFDPRWSVGLASSIFLMETNYGLMDGADDNLLDLRKASENSLEAFQFDLFMRYRFHQKWSTSFGINFSQINESSLNAIQGNEDVIIEDTIIGIVQYEDRIDYLMGDLTTKRSYSTLIQRYNTHRSISAPVQIFYHYKIKDRIFLDIGLGYEFNLWSSHNGFEIDLDYTEYPLSIDSDQRFKSKTMNYGLFTGRCTYGVSNSMNLYLGLHSKLAVNGIYNDASSIQKRFHLIGLKAGMEFNF